MTVAVSRAHGRVRRSTSAESRRESVGRLRRTSIILALVVSTRSIAASLLSVRSRTRSALHRLLSHAIALRTIILGVVGVGDQGSTCTRGTATKTADVLGKVVVVAAFSTASPITSTERDVSRTTAAHAAAATTTTHMMVTAAHVVARRTHHTRVVAITISIHRIRSGRHGREGATEAGGTTLEVGEAARGAGPITGPRAVLAGREGSENVSCAVEDARRGRRHFNGLFVKSTAVHAERLGSLVRWSVSC
jgi:hypothetical protein